MMHGHEKSDHAVVAVKPANKAERSAAELVEPRAGTEGNADWQSTHWAQHRVPPSRSRKKSRYSMMKSLTMTSNVVWSGRY
jgi:RNA-directed DNA polymerase